MIEQTKCKLNKTELFFKLFYIQSKEIGNFRLLKFYHGAEAWGNKAKEINYSSFNLDVISFVLFAQASEPS